MSPTDALRKRLDAAETLARVGTWELRDRTPVACSTEFLRIFGFASSATAPTPSLDEILGRVQTSDRPLLAAAVERALASGESYRVRFMVVRPDGTQRVVYGEGRVSMEGSERVLLAAVQDVTEHEQAVARLVAAESRYAAIVEHANDGVWVLDNDGKTTFVNRRMAEMLGYGLGELLGRRPSEFMDDGSRSRPPAERRAHYECRYVRKDGRSLWAANALSKLPADHGGGVLLVVTDITERKQLEERLRRAAEQDALTGVLNRSRFELLLDRLATAQPARGEPLALLLLDLDHFKFVNDSFGHAVGDGLLREIAASLPGFVRERDVIARLAADEFAIALPGASRVTAAAIAERILDMIRSRRWQTLSRLTASIGLAGVESDHATTGAQLLVAADVALYRAKSNGRDQVVEYTRDRGGTGFRWVDAIRSAIEDDRLVLYSQPIVSLTGTQEPRHELLLRMLAPDGTIAPPGAFIPAAEQFGMIGDLDRWVVRRAIELARDGLAVQVNLSGHSLGDAELRCLVERAIAAGLPPERLTFEVTETAAIRNIDAARDFAEKLRALGCSFALDDFGTGFGSLLYLKHLPVTQLKIDIEFVRELTRSAADERLVRAIVAMAKPLGLETVAEGVEDEATRALLQEIGVDFVQGFGIARPALIELATPAERD